MPALPWLVQGSTSWEHPWDPRAGAWHVQATGMGGGNRSHGPSIALVLPPPHQGQTGPGETKAGSSDGGRAGYSLMLEPCAEPARGIMSLLGQLDPSSGIGMWYPTLLANPLSHLPWSQPWSKATRTQERSGSEATWTHGDPVSPPCLALVGDQEWKYKPMSPCWGQSERQAGARSVPLPPLGHNSGAQGGQHLG